MTARLDANAFAGRRIALPETRQLDVLANLLLRRGAEVVRCPLISMHDSPDQAAVRDWLDRFVSDSRIGDLVILTGESVARLDAAAQQEVGQHVELPGLGQGDAPAGEGVGVKTSGHGKSLRKVSSPGPIGPDDGFRSPVPAAGRSCSG